MSSSSTIDIPSTVLDKVKKFRLTPSKAPITAQVYKIDKKSLTLELEEELLTGLTCVEDLVEGKLLILLSHLLYDADTVSICGGGQNCPRTHPDSSSSTTNFSIATVESPT